MRSKKNTANHDASFSRNNINYSVIALKKTSKKNVLATSLVVLECSVCLISIRSSH